MTTVRKRRIIEYVIIFCIGSFMYSLIEVLYRGYTHWTMTLTGGVVFVLLYFMNLAVKTRSFVLRGIIGALIITFTEFLVGVTVNLIFKMNVWDYSSLPGNILGQICPQFSLWWFLLSIPCVYVVIFLHWQLNKKLNVHQE
ncbi:MAG: putative ABC transporter permease [Faecalibacterium sp.]|nr:putative ABC transporter permease [Ruminococcus sp.]MCM1391962.1 putative ABC transporter permease [Ruminococcus sp.]MCM1485079.1 putative ABC transporter permease [Faecalibacterium sp.]